MGDQDDLEGNLRELLALRAGNEQLRKALKLILKLAIRDGMRWGPAISDAEDALSGETAETRK